jgi:acetolactate synthase-1/2/3 large subunit
VTIDVPIVGDCGTILQQMIDQINDNKEILDQEALSQWWMQINEWREQYGIYTQPRHEPSAGDDIKPQDVIISL